MLNKNFHSWRIGTINIRTGKDNQQIEIHEIESKTKLLVCCLQEVRRLNNNSVIITIKLNRTNIFTRK